MKSLEFAFEINWPLRTKSASGDRKLKFDQLYCINEWLPNDVLLVSKILLGYEEALWSKNLEINHASREPQVLFIS